MTSKATVTTEHIKVSEAARQLGRITHTTRDCRSTLGELHIAYIHTHGDDTAAIIPAWLGHWIEANADLVIQAIHADAANARA